MKKIAALLLTLLLCTSLLACVAVQNAEDAFLRSAEGAMIGKTFEEVEAAFGSLFVVYLEKDRPAAYVFNHSNVTFHFHAPLVQKRWAALLTDKTGFIPGAIALRDIQPTDRCIGVTGRIRDFGIAESDVSELSQSLKTLQAEPVETKTNTVYTMITPDQTYEVSVFCTKGQAAVTKDHQIQVMLTKLTPAADPAVTSFSFGGASIRVGETKVEVRGTSKTHKKITAQEFTDLVTYCPNLESLVLDYGDLSGVEQVGLLTDLTYLEIMTCGLKDISFLEDLKKDVTENLEELDAASGNAAGSLLDTVAGLSNELEDLVNSDTFTLVKTAIPAFAENYREQGFTKGTEALVNTIDLAMKLMNQSSSGDK